MAEPFGLVDRPANTTCIAPDRPVLAITAKIVFPNLFFDSAISMSQPLSDSSRWFLAERTGVIHSFANEDNVSEALTVLNIFDRLQYTVLDGFTDSQQAGITSFALHPNFPTTPYIYVAYNAKPSSTDPVFSNVSRFTSNDGGLTFDEATEQVLISIERFNPWHHVGQIIFGKDGYLYIGLGESEWNKAQNLNRLDGSILRIDVDNGTPYAIPADNPLVGTGFREEIFAWGLRNPWRFTIDKDTGDVWCGDVGGSNWEEVNHVVSGGNYGWSQTEGDGCRVKDSGEVIDCDLGEFIPPVLALDHAVVTAIIGGYVYRGKDIPLLQGAYLFADAASTTVMSLSNPNGGQPDYQSIFNSPINTQSFSQDNEGELYIFSSFTSNSNIYKIVRSSETSTFPQLLSETGCVDPNNASVVDAGMIPYDVNTILWSDGAEKYRWLAIPDGTTIDIKNDGDFDFPIGTVLMKQFLFDNVPHETRLLVRHADGGWAGYAYEWNDDLLDATLLETGKTKVLPNNVTWSYPSRGQCSACHTDAAGVALGPEVIQLNGDYLYPSTGVKANQLSTLENIGIFTNGLPALPEHLQALSPITLVSESLEQRARSYLHSNCSSCHRPNTQVPANIDFRYQTQFDQMNICNVVPGQGDLGVAGAKILLPGDPFSSVISLRTHALDGTRMPPIGTAIVDDIGVGVIDSWIGQLEGCDVLPLIASYNFNEGTGTVAGDSSGNGNYGTIIGGATWTTGKNGGGLGFDGVDDYVQVPAVNGQELSISAWFFKESVDTLEDDSLFGGFRWNADLQLREGFKLVFHKNNPDEIGFILVTEDSQGARTQKWAGYDLGEGNSVGNWHHVAVTYNQITGKQKMYLDGVLVKIASHPPGNTVVPLTSISNMRIGCGASSGAGFGFIEGIIDDVRVYNKALSDAEIVDLSMHSSVAPAAYWKFDDASGNVASDSSGNGNDGTVQGGAAWSAGKIDGALSFDGTDDYVSVSAINNQELTISAWIFKNSVDTLEDDSIFGGFRWNSDLQLREGFKLVFHKNNPNKIGFILVTEDSQGTRTQKWAGYDLGQGNSVGKWYHVTGTYSRTSGEQKFYLDGVLVRTSTHPVGNTIVPLTKFNNKMRIGANAAWGVGSSSGNIDGIIDAVRLYSREISAQEVLDLYNAL